MQVYKLHLLLSKLFLCLLLAVLFSCTDDESVPGSEHAVNVQLTLELSKQTGMRARSDLGDDALNENVIYSVDLFLYKKGDVAANRQPKFARTDITVTTYNASTRSAKLDVEIPKGQYDALFPTTTDTECEVYLIANRPSPSGTDNALPADDQSVASLKENTILYSSTIGERQQDNNGYYHPTVQQSFVMDGMATLSRNDKVLTGSVPMERVASKVSLIIKGIANEVTDENGVVWQSDKESVRLSFRRGCSRTKLGSTPTEYLYTAKEGDVFNINTVSLDKTVGTDLTTSLPFYTYPTNWGTDEKTRSHFILVIQWVKKNNPSESQLTYYEVNVNAAGTYTKRNTHYKIYQNIEVLGSTKEESAEVVYPSNYLILDWGSSLDDDSTTESDASMSKYRYLVVDETVLEMHNVTHKDVYYFTSDPIKVSKIIVKREDTGGNTSETVTIASLTSPSVTTDQNGDLVYVVNQSSDSKNSLKARPLTVKIHTAAPNNPNDRNYISIDHALLNDMSADADYTTYTIEMEVVHQDNSDYKETIKLYQYPMILVEAEQNSNYTDYVNGNTRDYNDNKGYMLLNNGSKATDLGGSYGISSNAGNKNPNRYIVSVTALNEGSSYIIGDPRNASVDNLNWSSFSSATTMKYQNDTNNRSLKYYHPTEDDDRTTSMLSPKFMIASSYGVTQSISKANAERRCASYQEDGYPAGRWRVPTQAEIEYVVGLSAKGVIPVLFGTAGEDENTKYWSANGAVNVNPVQGTVSATTSTSNGPVRCVYDLWYWTDKCNKNNFTWGDKSGGL